ncbi:arginine utilization regulatory protein [Maridesulfovibrio ferrireducens]|uniref:Arginine utilization regulatory protein n=1 Tax=Maridesulfovibrio ferrireducens TaxID=246191 RepID=A0A1G9AT08_9BACT|nr:sigma 54-interacting transcriptional regulator [Maridesulfovibrio ferrireducens]SDK30459.1 arginine utilization regulatory protein [Maridesulfovibrio ferrireducens]
MNIDTETFHNLNRETLLHPSITCLWDHFSMGMVIVNGKGIVNYMNPLQKRIDGFEHISVIGEPINRLYLANEENIIPTLQCLRSGKPLLKKTYWYKTRKNELFESYNDFFPLFRDGKVDGVISFTMNTSTNQIFTDAPPQKTKRGKKHGGSKQALFTFDKIIGQDRRFLDAIAHAKAATNNDSAVMIWGESGAGKELFAQSIHSASTRREGPFIPINCAAIPEALLEGMLFGTTKGAFTDALDKTGLFEEANGGTILLDELNSMPMGLQAKLLRVIQEKRIRRVGCLNEKEVDVKIISSLNEHPLKAIERGSLRRDLYYRLAVVGVSIPPLRNRQDDISILINSFLKDSYNGLDQQPVIFSDDILDLFQKHDWPGNVRELKHVIEGTLALLDDDRIITKRKLPAHFLDSYDRTELTSGTQTMFPSTNSLVADEEIMDFNDIGSRQSIPLKACIKEYEERCIRKVLRLTGGNVAKASRILEMSPSSLHYRIKMLGIL